MFFVCGIWCAADILSVSPFSDQTVADQARIQLTRLCRKNSFFKTSLPAFYQFSLGESMVCTRQLCDAGRDLWWPV